MPFPKLGLDVGVFTEEAGRLADEGKTPLYAAVDGEPTAITTVADPIKPSTPAAVKALHDLGLGVAMITGDNKRTAIARQLGIASPKCFPPARSRRSSARSSRQP